MSHNTHPQLEWLLFHPPYKPCDFNHKTQFEACAISPVPVWEKAHSRYCIGLVENHNTQIVVAELVLF